MASIQARHPLADLRRQTFDSIDAKKRLIEKQMSDAAAEQKRLADIEREKQSKLAEEERLRNEMRSKAEAAANQRRAEQALRESQLGAIPAPSVMDPEGYKWMRPYEIMMDELRNVLKPAVRANKEIKKWCFEKQRQIKVKFGQLTDEWSVLSRNTSELNLILNEAEGRGPEVYAWIANLFAKAIVSQAEDELSTERGRVFPSARVCVLLASAHPLVMDMVLARLIKKCPHIVPRQFTRSSTETMDDVKRKMRYRHKKDPDALQNAPIEWESDADYLRRMTSMLSLYAAIVQTVPEAGVNLHGIEYGWTWIARMLRLPNSSFLSADLMLAFLEIAGPLLLDTYGDMMRRVVNLIRTEYYASLPKDNPFAKASNARFEACLEHYIKTGQFKNIDWRFCHI
ncbi:GLE1-domain-containing protein [Ramicandelaber brevisporus]|nr:GLE1-domain-containing protein [Ramicandelaber brevisporus]